MSLIVRYKPLLMLKKAVFVWFIEGGGGGFMYTYRK